MSQERVARVSSQRFCSIIAIRIKCSKCYHPAHSVSTSTFVSRRGRGAAARKAGEGREGRGVPFLPFLFSAAARTPALCGGGRDGPVAAVPGTALVAAAAPWQPRGVRPGSGAPPLSPPRRAPPAAPLPRELRGVLSGKGNGGAAPPSVRERLRDRFPGAASPSPPSSARCVRARVCVCAAKGRGLSLRARGGREQCDGSGRPCAEGSSPRVRAGDRGVGAGLGGAVAACGGARRGTAAPGFASFRSSAPDAAKGAHPGGLPAAPGARCVRGAAGEERPRGESGGAERSGAAGSPAAEVGKVPSSPRSAAGSIAGGGRQPRWACECGRGRGRGGTAFVSAF